MRSWLTLLLSIRAAFGTDSRQVASSLLTAADAASNRASSLARLSVLHTPASCKSTISRNWEVEMEKHV